MISLNDVQLELVMATASHVPIEKRSQFLERIVESTNAARAAVTGHTVNYIVLIGTVLMIVLVAVAVVTLAARMTLI